MYKNFSWTRGEQLIMADLQLKHIYKRYAGGVTAVSDFTLDIDDKEFIILVGPSGCGKRYCNGFPKLRSISSYDSI